jgi:hypothetical protein
MKRAERCSVPEPVQSAPPGLPRSSLTQPQAGTSASITTQPLERSKRVFSNATAGPDGG